MRVFPVILALSFPSISVGEDIDFATQIQPILSENCYACHGPDESKAEADLRLDQRELALKGGDSGPAIIPGDAQNSLIIERIITSDEDDHMPPLEKKDPLKKHQIKLLTDWINQGAKWGEHWAFVSPKRPPIPKVANTAWPQNPIDNFVLHKLETEGLKPSPKTSPRQLLRRLSLDLTGLPPKLEELHNVQSSAFDTQCATLLASPHFGERWAREWLDAARYADSSGYEKDLPRQMHFYRDWVINALNADMGYDQFLIKQIAGDLLPNATQDDHIATGYLRNSMTNEEGGAKPEQFRIEGLFDRMDAIGKGILGLTTQCAQCHTHKYDPLTHDDYFGLFAYLNNTRETNYPAYTDPQHKRIAKIKKQTAQLETQLKNDHPGWAAEFNAWQTSLLSLPRTEWHIQTITMLGDAGQKYQNLADGSVINMGYAATKSTVKFSHADTLPEIQGIRLELLNDPYLPYQGPGRSIEGTAALTEFQFRLGKNLQKLINPTASVRPPSTPLKSKIYPLNAQYGKDDRITGPASYALDNNERTAWTTDRGPGRSNSPQVITFELATPLLNAQADEMKTEIIMNHGGWNSDDNQTFNLGKFRISHAATKPNTLDQLPPQVRKALETPFPKRTSEQNDLLFTHWRETNEQFATINQQIDQLWATHPSPSLALVSAKTKKPRTTRLFERGEQTKPQHEVKPHTPHFLHPIPDGLDPESRLTMAKWLVDPKSPTTARTIVNRIWQAYFGRGIVATPEDLGLQSPQPSHPKLLDWLSVELMENNWSLKHIHKLIVTSATYQQDSKHTSALRERDPHNRLLARGPRLRVPAETVRDIHLSVSGLIDLTLGGRSVYPLAPSFLFEKPTSYGPKIWNTETDSNRYRRALYTFRFRSAVYPMLQAFDAPSGEASCVRRTTSTTPLQALVTLNEPMSVEAALGLAHKILTTPGNLGQRLSDAFEHCTSRPPEKAELETLTTLYFQQLKLYQADQKSARDLIEAYKPVTLDLSPHEPTKLAAATAVAQTLLNLDETISKN